ncbi:MAG: hypothetical protein R3F48_01975 [Candidatus Zixiibacteriota bacterium]
MKSLYRVLFILTLALLCTSIVWAGGTKGQVGFGFKVTDQSSVIHARFWASDKLTIEPTFGIAWVDPGSSYSTTKRFAPGIGLLYHFRPGLELRPYIGMRFEAAILNASGESFADIGIAPLFGCQYFFSEHFSVSGEYLITYVKTDKEFSATMPYSDATYINTTQAVLVNFYF